MAINKISGNILQDNLQRGANLAIQGDLTYFDVTNNRVGIRTNTPVSELEVAGTVTVGDIIISNVGNISAGNVNINNLANPVANSDAATKFYTDSEVSNVVASLGNFTFSNTTISTSLASGNITIAPTNNSEVIIDTNSGLVIPTGNTAQRPGTPITGSIRWNTSLNLVEVYNGSNWENVGQDLAVISDQTITGDGANVNFTLIQDTLANAIIVSTNGVVQRPGTAYTVAGNVITFAEAPQTTDVIDVRFIAEVAWVNAISNDAGTSEIAVDSSGVANLSTTQSVQLPTYTVAQANALGNTASGQLIYVSNGNSGNPCLAVYSVNAWKIVSLGANITT